MTKKLLYQTSSAYIIFSVLVLIISAPIFYIISKSIYIEEADETLLLRKKEFLHYSIPNLKIKEIPIWNKFNRDIKIKEIRPFKSDSLFYTFYYETLDAELEPYRELNSTVIIEGKTYIFSTRISLVESEDLVVSIVIVFSGIILILLIGLFVINRKLAQKIWHPFYETLQQIERFEIDKSNRPKLKTTDIEEFNRLNQSIEKLIERNIAIFRSQREFIENAAHELQTPLAIFQAKVDTLMQRSDVSKGQAEILSSLNDSVARLNRLNKNLLLLSKIETNNYTEQHTFNLDKSISKHFDFFEEQAKSKNLSIKTLLTTNIEVKSNPVLVEILISNLFLNAIRHNVANGKIIITLSEQSLTFANTGQEQSLISDKLFNRFSKANLSSAQGNGLGLAIVKKIVELNNWQITYSFVNNFHYFSVYFSKF